ncbi:MAG: hypothetical protein K8R99_11660 [Actinomycetia bacterium]|nr:hypothetical protein [Actinomycetes bacterium]
MSVPRRYLTVWSGLSFPYAARLTIDSILLADPTAQVEIHVLGEHPMSSHFADLTDLADHRISVHDIDLDELFGSLRLISGTDCRAVFNAIPEHALSARSNILRYALLYRRGGVYVDFDVLVLRPLHDLANGGAFLGAERVWAYDEARVEGRWKLRMTAGTVGWALSWFAKRLDSKWFGGALKLTKRLRRLDTLWTRQQPNNAIIGAPAHSPFIIEVLRQCALADPTVRYALGPTLVSAVARQHPHLVRVLPEATLYPVAPGESYRFFEDRHLQLSDETVAIHYVNSNHRKLLHELQPDDARLETRSELFWTLARSVAAGNQSPAHKLDAR